MIFSFSSSSSLLSSTMFSSNCLFFISSFSSKFIFSSFLSIIFSPFIIFSLGFSSWWISSIFSNFLVDVPSPFSKDLLSLFFSSLVLIFIQYSSFFSWTLISSFIFSFSFLFSSILFSLFSFSIFSVISSSFISLDTFFSGLFSFMSVLLFVDKLLEIFIFNSSGVLIFFEINWLLGLISVFSENFVRKKFNLSFILTPVDIIPVWVSDWQFDCFLNIFILSAKPFPPMTFLIFIEILTSMLFNKIKLISWYSLLISYLFKIIV